MKKSEIQTLLSAARDEATTDPKAAFLQLALLNAKFDLALGRISPADYNLSIQDPARAIVRLEQQSAAFAKGTLIL